MILYLKFIVDMGKTSRLILSPAKLNSFGLYEDALHVYTEEGKFLKYHIRGPIEHIYKEETREDVRHVP